MDRPRNSRASAGTLQGAAAGTPRIAGSGTSTVAPESTQLQVGFWSPLHYTYLGFSFNAFGLLIFALKERAQLQRTLSNTFQSASLP